ncbi:MAG: hypothetical protein KGL39_00065 [Patescibacteria group bacterium]|nr:hypothetical protein [Patescibacteria group bacterium]
MPYEPTGTWILVDARGHGKHVAARVGPQSTIASGSDLHLDTVLTSGSPYTDFYKGTPYGSGFILIEQKHIMMVDAPITQQQDINV